MPDTLTQFDRLLLPYLPIEKRREIDLFICVKFAAGGPARSSPDSVPHCDPKLHLMVDDQGPAMHAAAP